MVPTEPCGELVFNLIDAELLNKTDDDSRADFRGLFDLDAELRHGPEFRPDDGD